MQKIKLISKSLMVGTISIMILIPLRTIIAWFCGETSSLVFPNYGLDFNWTGMATANMSLTARNIGFGGQLLADLILMTALYHLVKLLRHFILGNIFTAQTSRLLKLIAVTMLIYSIIGLTLIDTAAVLAQTFDKPAGQRVLNIGFGTPNLTFLFYSAAVYLISIIMDEAHKLKSDQDLTI